MDSNLITPQAAKPIKSRPDGKKWLFILILFVIAATIGVTVLMYYKNKQTSTDKMPSPVLFTEAECAAMPLTWTSPGFGDTSFPREYCYDQLAIKTKDDRYCNYGHANLAATTPRDYCVHRVAIEKDGIDYCKSQTLTSKADSCINTYMGISKSQDLSICSLMSSTKTHDECIKGIAIRTKNKALCSLLKDTKSPEIEYADCLFDTRVAVADCEPIRLIVGKNEADQKEIDWYYNICLFNFKQRH